MTTRKENIVRYTAEEIDEMLARGEDQTDWERVRNMTEEGLLERRTRKLYDPSRLPPVAALQTTGIDEDGELVGVDHRVVQRRLDGGGS